MNKSIILTLNKKYNLSHSDCLFQTTAVDKILKRHKVILDLETKNIYKDICYFKIPTLWYFKITRKINHYK